MSVTTTPETAFQYPADEVADFVLRDGSSVRLRPVRIDDATRVHLFFESISERSLIYRFFGITSVDWATRWALDVDHYDRYAIVAELQDGSEIVAHGAYIRSGLHSAEVAFIVTDREQGLGIATLMIAQLASVARRHRIERFTAEVLPNNYRMLGVFRDCGFAGRLRSQPGSISVELQTHRQTE